MVLLTASVMFLAAQTNGAPPRNLEPGSLVGSGKDAVVLPLKDTTVNADVSGFGARVTVVQTFTNPSSTPIEAVYTFPLPAEAAVDHMRMKIGDRIIDGQIKRREEARMIYEAAKSQGKAAALLDQERPNIFTQSVANILPKATVRIEISYVQLLKYENGEFEFTFPMVVGPRYLGNAPDPAKISPPVIPKGMRTGSNISLTVNVDAGAPILQTKSVLHDVKVVQQTSSAEQVTLLKKDEIPNRDFILHYRVATNSVQSAFLAKYDPVKGGHFSLVLLPPKAPMRQQIANREVIFVIDQTGSQSGFPIAKSIELTLKLMQTLRTGDTFNVIGFTTGVNPLWKHSMPNTPENKAAATRFVKGLTAGGGTDIRQAMVFAYNQPPDPNRLRLFIFNSDGYVGDEANILNEIRTRHGNSRLFTFGIGDSVNRYLIDAMSEEGRGDSEIVTLASKSDDAVDRFVERTQSPILVDVKAKFDGDVDVSDVLPAQIPDVFSEKPIVIYGRYSTPGRGRLTLTGTMAGQPWSRTIDLVFPSDRPGGESIPTLWARRMVDKLERDYALGTRKATSPQEGQNKVTDLALEYGIMSQYTSFVAVEQRVINVGGKQMTVHVPVEMAHGVSYEGVGLDSSTLNRPAAFSGTASGMSRGGGGFAGGASAGGAGKAYSQPLADKSDGEGVSYLAFDPASNTFYVGDDVVTKFKQPARDKAFDERKQALIDIKVHKSLRKAAGPVAVELWLTSIDETLMAKLKELGFTVDVEDKGMKIVFGRCDAKQLTDLAQLSHVRSIEPIK